MARQARTRQLVGEERDYRDVAANARGSWLLTLLGVLLSALGIALVPGGGGTQLPLTLLAIAVVLGGVALLYGGHSLRRDARRAKRRHDEGRGERHHG
ncbi:hypothetical protein [Olsenella sp. HMSC062G07]|uniref:hypothetical protein n=1 Tax=Olsenella sp. HMSC062G07 TaxID=1739330 RepID=UPI0008A1AE45|nr:hypothetical protein [Olsenella sp. HMSC062G07]OFK23939.1 hypothetical protein HMPREF2826_08775 [Olsenella sp. HMSC062G07]